MARLSLGMWISQFMRRKSVNRSLPRMKKDVWIAIVWTVLAALAGVAVVEAQTIADSASATMAVNAVAPGTSTPLENSDASATDSLTQASDDAAEIPTQLIMSCVFKIAERIAAQEHRGPIASWEC